MTASLAPGRAPNPPVTSHESAPPSIASEIYKVTGYRAGAHITTRIQAPSKDHAIGIAHERGIRVAECEVKK